MIIYQHGTIKNYRYIGDVSENHANSRLQGLHTKEHTLAPNAGKRVVNPLELVTCKD